jgi:hypothetical protein
MSPAEAAGLIRTLVQTTSPLVDATDSHPN